MGSGSGADYVVDSVLVDVLRGGLLSRGGHTNPVQRGKGGLFVITMKGRSTMPVQEGASGDKRVCVYQKSREQKSSSCRQIKFKNAVSFIQGLTNVVVVVV